MEERKIRYALLKLGSFPLFKFIDGGILLQALHNWLLRAKIVDSDVAEWVGGEGSTMELKFRSGMVKQFSILNPHFPLIFFTPTGEQDADIFKIIPLIAVPRES